MSEEYRGMALGMFELDNLVACFVALDAASKAANVRIQGVERNRLKSGACVKTVSYTHLLTRIRPLGAKEILEIFEMALG